MNNPLNKLLKLPKVNKKLVANQIAALERQLNLLKASLNVDTDLSHKATTNLYGQDFKCDKDVHITVGPVIGQVTSTTAIVLLEVTLSSEVTIHLLPKDNQHAPRVAKTVLMSKNRPRSFFLEHLLPNTSYNVVFEGVNAKDAKKRTGLLRTMPSGTNHELRVVALSCNNPVDFHDKETNMWEKLEQQVINGEVDVVLHMGDQVYGWKEFEDAQAILRYSGIPRGSETIATTEKEVIHLHKLIKNRIRDIYRFTWNLPGTRTVLARCSNLMIWSDNDIYNDFTIAKQDGQDNIEPLMIFLAHQVYREYQRQLWDVNYATDGTTDEFHYHKWGITGVFFNDMRGNRITTKGEQRSGNPLLNDRQWESIQQALADPALKNFILCAEIPFIGNSPEECTEGAKNPRTYFLSEHWAFHKDELIKLLDLVFAWKSKSPEEHAVLLVGGDIHAGVTTTVTDTTTGLELIQITATPMTTKVSQFYPPLQGKISDRFAYTHVPLAHCRNYGYFTTKLDGSKAIIDTKFVTGNPIW